MKGSPGEILKKYLLDHEADIFMGNNDFGELGPVFKFFIGREARISDPWKDMEPTVEVKPDPKTVRVNLDVHSGSFSADAIFGRPGKRVI